MRAEEILGAILIHSQRMTVGRPDPQVIAASKERRGKDTPDNWREVRDENGKVNDAESWPAIRTALGTSARRMSTETILTAAADALLGMRKREWRAIEVALGINKKSRNVMFLRLMTLAERARESQPFWPEKVTRGRCGCGRQAATDYVPDLVELAIRELEFPGAISTNRERARWLSMAESTFYRDLARPYFEVSNHVFTWYHAGIGHIERRLKTMRQSRG